MQSTVSPTIVFLSHIVANSTTEWNLKPVSFAVELFSILRDGSQARLTAIRFTQTRGSGPSLRKLVDLLSTVLENGYLHEDSKETKEIARLILTGRLENDDTEI
jgi:hypothetical protein